MSLTLSFEKKSGMCSNKLHNVNKGNVILENKEMHLGDLDPARGGHLVGWEWDSDRQKVSSWKIQGLQFENLDSTLCFGDFL